MWQFTDYLYIAHKTSPWLYNQPFNTSFSKKIESVQMG